MAWEACFSLGLPIYPITADEVAAGHLQEARLLLAPGGWPSLKYKALGQAGGRAVRNFVQKGGFYLGLCGGAGLALTAEHGLGLMDLGRAPASRKILGLSGPVMVQTGPQGRGHAMWSDLPSPAEFHVWWPGQMAFPQKEGVKVLAVYAGPAPGLCSADIQVDEVESGQWEGFENDYGLRLDPAGLVGLPAVAEASCGAGRVMVSHIHFDTPRDPNGAQVLLNLWQARLGTEPGDRPKDLPDDLLARAGSGIFQPLEELWESGKRLGLWQPRHPAMPLWKRGARGLEFWTLLRLGRAIAGLARLLPQTGTEMDELKRALTPVRNSGQRILNAQAARLSGEKVAPKDETLERRWFPAPRQTGGQLAHALSTLERTLLSLIRRL